MSCRRNITNSVTRILGTRSLEATEQQVSLDLRPEIYPRTLIDIGLKLKTTEDCHWD